MCPLQQLIARSHQPQPPKELQNNLRELFKWREQFEESTEDKQWQAAMQAHEIEQYRTPNVFSTIDEDGSFRIEGVPAGAYGLMAHVRGSSSFKRFVGNPIVIPAAEPGKPDEVVDLGTLQSN